VVKIGRTHLMDAVPIRLGQESAGLRRAWSTVPSPAGGARPALHELALGGPRWAPAWARARLRAGR
jgi:fumarate hydratase class II